MTVIGALVGSASAQGVRQVCPLEILASAPGGSDSNCTLSIDGSDLKISFIELDEHAARASAPPMMAITRYIIGLIRPLERHRPPAYEENTGAVMWAQHIAFC